MEPEASPANSESPIPVILAKVRVFVWAKLNIPSMPATLLKEYMRAAVLAVPWSRIGEVVPSAETPSPL